MTRPADIDPMDEIREAGIRDMLKGIGENPDREGLRNTPQRVVRAWREICSGYSQDPSKLVTMFDGENYDEMISVGPISFYSTCEHHLLPFFGDAWVAYIPSPPKRQWLCAEHTEPWGVCENNGCTHTKSFEKMLQPSTIIGLSKLPRIVEIFARRLQNQERLTQEVVNCLNTLLAPRGAACFIRAQHFCMMARGVRQHKAKMSTSKLVGVFQQPEVRAEFFELTKER